MKAFTYIMVGAYLAFVVLLIVSNRISYDMGINNGKVLLCDSQSGYLINDDQGERCIDKDAYNLLKGSTSDDPFNDYIANLSYGDITQ